MTAEISETGTPVSESYWIPDQNIDLLQERIGKLNKRAEKLGVEPIAVQEISERFDLYYRPDPLRYAPDPAPRKVLFSHEGEALADAQARYEAEGRPGLSTFVQRFVEIAVFGSAPKIAGWTFVAVIQSLGGEEGNILARVPLSGYEGEIPEIYRDRGPVCDHCQLERRRNDTYLVLGESGEWKQVGKNCLRDFTGHNDPHAIAAMAQMMADFYGWLSSAAEEWGEGGSHGRSFFAAEGFLAETATIIRVDGWTSRAKAREFFGVLSTVDKVVDCYHSKHIAGKPHPPEEVTAADIETGRKTLEWARAITDEEVESSKTNYLYNLRAVCRQDAVQDRHIGILGSAVAAYKRAVEKESLRREKAAQRPSEHIGEPGQRLSFRAVLVALREFEGDWGVRTLHRFEDEHGNVLVWWKSGEADMQENASYRIAGTVKGHDDYEGVKQTTLSRVTTDFACEKPKARRRPKGTTFKNDADYKAWFLEVLPAGNFEFVMKGSRWYGQPATEYAGSHYGYSGFSFQGWDV